MLPVTMRLIISVCLLRERVTLPRRVGSPVDLVTEFNEAPATSQSNCSEDPKTIFPHRPLVASVTVSQVLGQRPVDFA